MPIECAPHHLDIVRRILSAHVPECQVWAFGSRVSGPAKPFSDLDLAVISDTPLGARRLALLADAFAESDLPIKVDVVEWARTPESLRAEITQHHAIMQ